MELHLTLTDELEILLQLLPILVEIHVSPQEVYNHAQQLFVYGNKLKDVTLSMIEALRSVHLNRDSKLVHLQQIEKFFQLEEHPNPELKYQTANLSRPMFIVDTLQIY